MTETLRTCFTDGRLQRRESTSLSLNGCPDSILARELFEPSSRRTLSFTVGRKSFRQNRMDGRYAPAGSL